MCRGFVRNVERKSQAQCITKQLNDLLLRVFGPTIETVADNRIRFEAPTAKAMDHPTTFNLPLCQTVHIEDTYPSPAGSVYREFGLVSPDRRELEPDRRGGLGMVVWR